MRVLSLLFLASLLLLLFALPHARAEGEFDDEDDELVHPVAEEVISPSAAQQAAASAPSPASAPASGFDDEEFEGFEKREEPQLTFKSPNRTPFSFSEFKIEDYWTEVGILAFFVLYGFNYFYGRKQNEEIAKAWVKANWSLLERNFAYFGDGKGNSLIKDSESDYIFYASGRQYCKSLTANLELRKRQDLASLLLEFVFPAHDKINIEVVMDDKDMPPLVFTVLPKEKFLSLKKDHYDLSTFTKALDHERKLPESLTVASESPELLTTLLTPKVTQTIKNNIQFFEFLKFSDQPKVKPISPEQKFPKTLSFTFRLPPVNSMEKSIPLQELVIFFIDHLSEADFGPAVKSKVDKARAAAQEALIKEVNAQKQEDALNKKAEKQKAEREKLDTMTPEQQRKYEAKLYQKELKKKQASRMKFVKG